MTRTYAYDGDGLLRSRTEGPATTGYLWDASTAPAPLLVAGTDRAVHGLGPLYLARADGTTLTLVRDALGSVRAEVSDQGAITKAFRYAAYGEIVQPNANVPTLLGFAGELRDPSGLIYLRARWYDVETGRFMSRDPFRGVLGRPSSLNAFSYVAGRPITLADPRGLTPLFAGVDLADWAYGIADVFRDLDSPDPVRRSTAFVALAAGGVAVAGLAVAGVALAVEAAPGVLVKSGLVEGVAIAGATTATTLRAAPRLVARYGGELTDWAKFVSRGVLRVPFGGPVIQIHWYENSLTNLTVEAKWKLY